MKHILKLRFAFIEKPIYVLVYDLNANLKAVIKEAFRLSDCKIDAEFLDEFYYLVGRHFVDRDARIRDLRFESLQINGESIEFTEILMVREHLGA